MKQPAPWTISEARDSVKYCRLAIQRLEGYLAWRKRDVERAIEVGYVPEIIKQAGLLGEQEYYLARQRGHLRRYERILADLRLKAKRRTYG